MHYPLFWGRTLLRTSYNMIVPYYGLNTILSFLIMICHRGSKQIQDAHNK